MPDERGSRFRFHPVFGMGLLQGEGELTLEGWDRAAQHILDWPALGGTRRILSDRRQMAGDYPTWMQDQILTFIASRGPALGHTKWAVVVPDDSPPLELVRDTARRSQGTRVQIRAFTDMTEAIRWLLGFYEDEQITALLRWVEQGR